jgi:RAB6-interacting golgin
MNGVQTHNFSGDRHSDCTGRWIYNYHTIKKKSELKEHLTEHLYTIIHQNELRKANKLSELMKELEMEQNTEYQILPSLHQHNTDLGHFP